MSFLRPSALNVARSAWTAVIACAVGLIALSAHAADSVVVNTGVTYQTMTGWEVHARAWEQDKVNNNYDHTARTYAPVVAAKLVNELGFNRLQLPVRSGWMNNVDYWTRFVNRQISYQELGKHWYEKQSGAPFQYAEFDYNVETWLLPMKQLLEAKSATSRTGLPPISRARARTSATSRTRRAEVSSPGTWAWTRVSALRISAGSPVRASVIRSTG
jgi:hypothetical protein